MQKSARTSYFNAAAAGAQVKQPAPLHGSFNLRVFRFFSIMRYLTLTLTSLFFLLEAYPLISMNDFILLIILFGLAAISVRAYLLYQNDNNIVKLLAFLETLGITVLVIFTGGLGSPFVWYFINPLVLASLHLPYLYTWGFLIVFMSGSLVGNMHLQGLSPSLSIATFIHFDMMLILPLVTLMIQIFCKIYYTLAEQSQQLEVQQEELVAAYIDLSKNHQLMQTLSDFQRNVVACKNEHDIYNQLIAASTFAFPLEWAAVLDLEDPLFPERTQPFEGYELVSNGKLSKKTLEPLVGDIRDRWQELFSSRGIMVGQKNSWIAVPIRLEKRKTIAIFVAQAKDMNSLNQLKKTLVFFIQFAEQVIQGLHNLHQTEETLQHLSNIYEAVETISRRDDPREILDLFCTYARGLTGCEKIIFWVENIGSEQGDSETGSGSIYSVKGQISVFPEEYWQEKLLKAWEEIKENPVPLIQVIEDNRGRPMGQMVCVPVKSWARSFGILAALHAKKNYSVDEVVQKLAFLAKMGAIAIERNLTELFTDKLMLLEEQKRIANEIHDSISQNLFSVVYGLESVSKHKDVSNSRLKSQIASIQEVASQTAKELRVLIYRLSPRKRGDETFVKGIQDYLNGLSNINNIAIDFNVNGSEEYLNPAMRNAFYRIIKEATGNSIRHGSSSEIQIKLDMNPFTATLDVVDNGNGFDVEALYDHNRYNGGLGILNMQELTHSLQGSFEIKSIPGETTRVSCHVPTSPVSRGKVLSR